MNDEDFLKAKDYCLKLLSIRPRSISEISYKLRFFLKKKNLPENLQEKVISRLLELNLLNDLEFTKWWLDQRSKSSIRGKNWVRQELLSKGINREIIADLLDKQGNETELLKARKIINKKISTMPKENLKQYLFRRGFSFDVIKKAIDETIKKG